MYADDDNYLKLDYIVDNAAGQPVARRIEFRSEIGGVVQNPQPQVDQPHRGGLAPAAGQGRRHLHRLVLGGRHRPGPSFEPLTNAAVGARAEGRPVQPRRARRQASKPVSFDYFRAHHGAARADDRRAGDHRRRSTGPVGRRLVHRPGDGHADRGRRRPAAAAWRAPSTSSTARPTWTAVHRAGRGRPATAPTRCGSARPTRRATSRRRSPSRSRSTRPRRSPRRRSRRRPTTAGTPAPSRSR